MELKRYIRAVPKGGNHTEMVEILNNEELSLRAGWITYADAQAALKKKDERIEQLTRALEAAKPYVERVHKQLWRTEFTAGGPAALAVAETAELVDAALAPPAEAREGDKK